MPPKGSSLSAHGELPLTGLELVLYIARLFSGSAGERKQHIWQIGREGSVVCWLEATRCFYSHTDEGLPKRKGFAGQATKETPNLLFRMGGAGTGVV